MKILVVIDTIITMFKVMVKRDVCSGTEMRNEYSYIMLKPKIPTVVGMAAVRTENVYMHLCGWYGFRR